MTLDRAPADAAMCAGGVPHAAMMWSIELFGTVVAPAVKKTLGD